MLRRTIKDVVMALVRWAPDRTVNLSREPAPSLLTAVGRGLLNRCPVCGRAHVFNGYLRVVTHCANCAAPLGRARADDAPPYFTILVTGHVIVPLMFWMDQARNPPIWVLAAIFLPATLVMSLALLRPIKGAMVGLMFKLNMLKPDGED
jgi:uncharacterized protein (DUF983 family)